MEITRPRTCNGNYTPRDLYCTPWESCGEGAYRNLLFYCRVVLTVLKSIHPRRGKKNANFERADFFSISSELKIHGGLPNESLISDKSFSSKLLKTISLLKMTILKFVAKHLRIGILINQ